MIILYILIIILLVVIILFVIFSKWFSRIINKYKLRIEISLSILTAFTAIVLAGAALYSVNKTKETLDFMREESIIQNQPYLGISTIGNKITVPRNDTAVITFVFGIANTGKTPAKVIRNNLKSAMIMEKFDQQIYMGIKSNNIHGVELDIIEFEKQAVLVFYPGQNVPLGDFTIKKENLHKEIEEGKRHLYLEFQILYNTLFFGKYQRNYLVNYYLYFPFKEDIYTIDESIQFRILQINIVEMSTP